METSTLKHGARLRAYVADVLGGTLEARPTLASVAAAIDRDAAELMLANTRQLDVLRDLRRLLDSGALFTANQGPERDAAAALLDRLNQLLPEDPRGKARKEGS